MTIRSGILTAIIGGTGAGWTPLLIVPGGNAGRASPSPYGDAELKSFATAATRVRRITDTYVEKMVTAKSEEEKKRLEQLASSDMVQAVKKEGLSLDTYQAIADRVQTDPDLAERVTQKLREVA